MEKSLSTTANLFSSNLKTGLVGLFFCLMIGAWYSCKKDSPLKSGSTLTISKAKEIFISSGIEEAKVHSRDETEECGDGNIHITLDWGNAVEYENGPYNLSLVEVPVLNSNLSTTKIFTGGVENGSAPFEEGASTTNILFSQDSNGLINVTILKISGTPAYSVNNNIKTNAFKNMDGDFEGRVGYYNLSDSLLESYLVSNGNVFESVGPSDTGHLVSAADRWAFCVESIKYVNCTGDNHTWAQRFICKCGSIEAPFCTPPQKITTLVECGGPIFLPPSFYPQIPDWVNPWLPPPPTNTGQVGGGSGGNNSNPPVGSFGYYVKKYKETHNNEDLWNDPEKKKIAWACFEDLVENSTEVLTPAEFQAEFNTCVEEQKGCNCLSIYERLNIGTHSPYPLLNLDYTIKGVVENKNCKTGTSTGRCEVHAPSIGLPIGYSYTITENVASLIDPAPKLGPKCVWKVWYKHRIVVQYFYNIGLADEIAFGPYETEVDRYWIID